MISKSWPRVLYWLTRDTFRQSFAYGIFWIVLAITAICVAVCASAQVEGAGELSFPDEQPDFLPRDDIEAQDEAQVAQSGVKVVRGEFTVGFGAIAIPLARDAKDAVRFLQLLLGEVVAGAMGILLCLTWTSGFLPGFLDPKAISVLLAKPPSRRALLTGKYLGVLAFVLFHSTLFVLGTWAALGLKTGVWDRACLLGIPLLLAQFAVFFGFSLLLATATRSTVVCVFGSIVFWLLCWGMNFGRHAVLAESYGPSIGTITEPLLKLVELGYWILPKPADFGLILFDGMQAGEAFGKLAVFQQVQEKGDFHPLLSVLSSIAFGVVTFFAASREFEQADY